MLTIKRWLALPTALIAILAASTITFAQGTASTSTVSAPLASWGSAPAPATHHGGSFFGNVQQQYQKWKNDFDLVSARNGAWPMPFNCQDREIYYRIWATQYGSGLQVAHALTSEHFDDKSNELNQAGRSKVAWIMQNAPRANKQVFVYEDQTGETVDRRIAHVRSTIDQWYGHMGPAVVARSRMLPNQVPALYQEIINRQYSSGQPIPVIPVDTGQTISGSVDN